MAELPQPAPFPSAAEAALLKGNKIEAIKVVREVQHVDLKEAKDIVERHVAAHPGLRAQMENARAAAGNKLFPWLVAVIIISIVVYYLLAGR